MTRQTSEVLARLPLSTSNRQARWLVKQIEDGDLDINPPYQRGAVWTEDQQVALMRSLLSGVPVPTLIVNDRHGQHWTDTATYDRHSGNAPSYAVVDGKQRLLCLKAWFDGELAIPASWIEPECIDHTEDTSDGPYVRSTGLNDYGRRATGERILLPVGEAMAVSLREEAEIYLLVNGGGTPQSDADMDNARRIAEEI
ncbi:hypothetical protein AMIS_20100 [Actinoplanes missouriensis 431]|uniref:GmrSD restriction endonucleases N-terminal domain-containing protein n=1 Tax=Actinoplanes missouriensis (strain ATCC 14538 / DSM 43046 / CBS 188.64 / JCM 3121 / NBRC 102363 / NCIMB 12654 / NRRL B-3342 / UNCC 431) TaxID=512565 RepID=I0H2J3_ACTM4|nr:DUF262 domain-containing protein [Actinoplanes missouriensis]BAL87230.1 hypothetical protein AMIS_20100 [Actinoplanes missouriensis 431]